MRVHFLLAIALLTCSLTGCATSKRLALITQNGGIHETVGDFTNKKKADEVIKPAAKIFLSDAEVDKLFATMPAEKRGVYCKDFAGSVGDYLNDSGWSTYLEKGGSYKTFCTSYFTIADQLSTSDKRNLLIALGDSYFEGQSKQAQRRKGMSEETTAEKISGIAMIAWFQANSESVVTKADTEKTGAVINPGTLSFLWGKSWKPTLAGKSVSPSLEFRHLYRAMVVGKDLDEALNGAIMSGPMRGRVANMKEQAQFILDNW